MRWTTRTMLALVAVVLLLAVSVATQQTESAEALLRAAMDTAVVDGDLYGAIKQYQTIANRFKTDRAVVATALVQMADCYQKLGDAEAPRIYDRVVREFADQKDAVAEARARLAAWQSADVPQGRQAARQIFGGPIVTGYASLSADGRYLSFDDVTDVQPRVAIHDLATNSTRHFTDARDPEGYGWRSHISPDGSQVAYVWMAYQQGSLRTQGSELRILPLRGGRATEPRIVHRGEGNMYLRGWTPDGRQLLMVRELNGAYQIAIVSVQDGSVRVLKSLDAWRYPATTSISPDGRQIAYDAPAGRADDKVLPRDIFLLATDGSRETVVVQSPAQDGSPIWLPDGSRILFLSDRTGSSSLWSLPIKGGEPQGRPELLRADIGPIDLRGMTRSGSLYYLSGSSSGVNVYIAELDAAMKATKAPTLATETFINSNSGPAWSPDGHYLAYYSRRGRQDSPNFSGWVPVIRSLKTGEEREVPIQLRVLTGGGAFGPPLRWFPDGRSLLVLAREQPQGNGYYRVDLASGHVERVLRPNGGGVGITAPSDLSPDGKAILYVGMGGEALIRFDIETGRETILKRVRSFRSVAISPDGTEVAYMRQDVSTPSLALEVMSASGSGETREVVQASVLGDEVVPYELAWSRDRRYLLFVKGGLAGPHALWRVPLTGGTPEATGVSVPARIKAPTVHPDGRRMAFQTDKQGKEVWALDNFLPQPRTAQ